MQCEDGHGQIPSHIKAAFAVYYVCVTSVPARWEWGFMEDLRITRFNRKRSKKQVLNRTILVGTVASHTLILAQCHSNLFTTRKNPMQNCVPRLPFRFALSGGYCTFAHRCVRMSFCVGRRSPSSLSFSCQAATVNFMLGVIRIGRTPHRISSSLT